MERRTLLKIVMLGGFVPAALSLGEKGDWEGSSGDPTKYVLQFFTEEESEMLDQLMEMIIPNDEHSPGAHAAEVNLFADLIIATSSDEMKRLWRNGLQLMREEAAHSSLQEALSKSAAHEDHPNNELENFFVQLKAMTVKGYYTSSIGIHDDLQYQGNTYIASFPGCAGGMQG
jgi:hypothetical protein